MIISAYFLVYLLTVILAYEPRIIPNRFFFLVWLVVIAFLSFSIRLVGIENALPESDIGGYIMNMKIEGYILPYHAREFIFWLGTRYLYQLTGDAFYVFFITDLILFLAFYKSLGLIGFIFPQGTKLENIKYLYFGAILFFPFFLGMHNTYRQLLAAAIFLYALGYAGSDLRKSTFFYFISLFVHNSMLLFLPILVLTRKGLSLRLIGLISVIPALGLYFFDPELIFALTARSSGIEVGRNIAFLYLLVLTVIISLVISLEYIAKSNENLLFLKILFFCFFLYLGSYFLLAGQGAERVFMLIFTLFFPLLGIYFDGRTKPQFLTRLLYFHVCLVPLLSIYGSIFFEILDISI